MSIRASIGLIFLACTVVDRAAADEPTAAIQRRLVDAQCWAGPVDGRPSRALTAAIGKCPLLDPALLMAGPTHNKPVTGVAANASCTILVSVSADKTARVWDPVSGALKAVIRPPIGPKGDGEIRSVALSPNGRLVAMGIQGLLTRADGTQSVGIYDLATATLVARAGPLEELAFNLAFSPNGSRLAVAERGRGLHVYATDDWRELNRDIGMRDREYIVGLGFTPDGRLLTATSDGRIRRYDQNGLLQAADKVEAKDRFVSMSIDPSGSTIALGFRDTNETPLVDTSTLKVIDRIPGPPRTVAYPGGAVAFNARGMLAMSTGRSEVDTLTIRIMKKGDAGAWTEVRDTTVASESVFSLAPCGDGFAFGTGEPGLGVLSPERGLVWKSVGSVVDMSMKLGAAFTVSADAGRVRFGLKHGELEPVLFDADLETLTDSPSRPPDLLQPDVSSLPIKRWGNYFDPPLLDGKPIRFDTGDMGRSLAIAPGAASFVIGSSQGVSSYARDGAFQWARREGLDEAFGVNIAGSAVVSAHADGTIRWRRLSDGREYLALHVDPASRRWVAFTPEGYYMSSPGGDDLIGWHVNRGWTKSGDFYPVSRFREKFYRPDIVKLSLSLQNSGLAIERAVRVGGRAASASVMEALPPVVTITAPRSGAVVATTNVIVDFNVRSPSGKPLEGLQALVDNRPAPIEDLTQTIDRSSGGLQWSGRGRVLFDPDRKELGLVARAGGIASEAARIRLSAAGAGPPSADDLLRPTLYALVVGVGAYRNPGLAPLAYAAKDARDLAAVLSAGKGSLYRDAKVMLLTDADATIAGVRKGLAWLEKEVKSRDVGLVYLAGHGKTDAAGTYWFMTQDSDPNALADAALSRDELLSILPNLAGQPVVLLDTCYSGAVGAVTPRGAVDANAIVGDLSKPENRIVTLAAATGREISQENAAWGNGAFTKALIQGLRDGRAELASVRTGKIRMSELALYVSNTVRDMTGNSQHPVLNLPDPRDDLTIWAVR